MCRKLIYVSSHIQWRGKHGETSTSNPADLKLIEVLEMMETAELYVASLPGWP